ncbi:LysR substrate-binding domain-containing protein [Paucibacter sp. APW11]|uniref:LysR substrate-binding domain-containing protein n=1 Tax=Roseateles aquae TaxID=3077235 RepID=A0ABU3P845_9BURK|nr:LysR substrate-binding domain-containing protein [Paucibacter sp. APW11]MDT8998400.1 LysR substrate-binding domain-containing protein [Paucibacter sp. APW11]
MSRLPRLPLQYLAAFRAAAASENLRAAAEQLHLTHSAVSQQIRAMELQLGFALFERSGRRIQLNAAGRALQRAVERAWVELDQGLQQAAAASGSAVRALRITSLPSFAQRWLMPRIGRWHAAHPEIALELHASQLLVDLEREGYQLALRQGQGPWTGLVNEVLMESRLIPVCAPALAQRLIGAPLETLAEQALLGDAARWTHWFANAGLKRRIVPMASFNDAGLLVQAAEQGMGVALARELLAADALLEGRLVRVSAQALEGFHDQSYHIVYPPALKDEPALRALCEWLHQEIALSARQLRGDLLPPLMDGSPG